MYFLIESGVFGLSETGTLKQALTRYNIPFKYGNLAKLAKSHVPGNCCFYGSIYGNYVIRSVHGNSIYKKLSAEPQRYSVENFRKWFLDYPNVLLNTNCTYRKVTDDLYTAVESGEEPSFFMRSPLGTKEVPGTVVIPEEAPFLRGMYANHCVATFPVKNISTEVRAVVYNGKIITASQYIDENGRIDLMPKEWEDLFCFNSFNRALYFLNRFNVSGGVYAALPDGVDLWHTVDFAWDLDAEDWKIVELNSFWCAGLYGCNWDKILEVMISED